MILYSILPLGVNHASVIGSKKWVFYLKSESMLETGPNLLTDERWRCQFAWFFCFFSSVSKEVTKINMAVSRKKQCNSNLLSVFTFISFIFGHHFFSFKNTFFIQIIIKTTDFWYLVWNIPLRFFFSFLACFICNII